MKLVAAHFIAALFVASCTSAVLVSTQGTAAFAPVWVSVPLPTANNSALNLTYTNVALRNGTDVHGNVSAHIARIADPTSHWHVHCPGCNGTDSCTGARETVSKQAAAHECAFATNGGPFGMHRPDCIGPMVSDGTVVHNATSPEHVCVGTAAPNRWFFGTIPDAAAAASVLPAVQNLLCGFGWLVYAGEAFPYHDGGKIAPRTIMGLTAAGELVEAVIDGCEVTKTGMTHEQTTRYAIEQLGLTYAVNLDGGGSSTAYYPPLGGVQGCPTGIDLPICLERTVVTITCLK